MTNLVITINEDADKRRRRRRFAELFIGTGLISLVAAIFLPRPSETSYSFGGAIIIGINFLALGLVSLGLRAKKSYIKIDDEAVEWLFVHMDRKPNIEKIIMDWKDIRRIKYELDGSIQFYLDSSFGYNMSFADFNQTDKSRVMQVLEVLAAQYNIAVVNSSALATV